MKEYICSNCYRINPVDECCKRPQHQLIFQLRDLPNSRYATFFFDVADRNPLPFTIFIKHLPIAVNFAKWAREKRKGMVCDEQRLQESLHYFFRQLANIEDPSRNFVESSKRNYLSHLMTKEKHAEVMRKKAERKSILMEGMSRSYRPVTKSSHAYDKAMRDVSWKVKERGRR